MPKCQLHLKIVWPWGRLPPALSVVGGTACTGKGASENLLWGQWLLA